MTLDVSPQAEQKRRKAATAIAALGMCLVFLIPGFQGLSLAAQMKEATDEAILAAVDFKLLTDEAVFSNSIDIAVVDGVVTLSGSADNLLSKDRAVVIARAVKGVRSVVDLIEVVPPEVSDRKLRKMVNAAFMVDPVVESYELEVDADKGVVKLWGTVDSWTEKWLSARVASGVEGVRRVVNNILIEYPDSRSDEEIKKEINRKFDIDVYLSGTDIDVEVENGKVILKGSVGSAEEKFRAWASAFVTGVGSVDDSGVNVEPWSDSDIMRAEEPSGVLLSDPEIQEAVKDGLMFDPRVNSFQPRIYVQNGKVTLTGTVSDLAAKRAAVETAANTVGVLEVRDLLKVRPLLSLSDGKLERDVESAILRDPFIELADIDISVRSGVVELHGIVDTAFEKVRVTEVASAVRGVVLVENFLGLAPGAYSEWIDDWDLKQNIERQIFWSPYVDADQVFVTVTDGVAVLTGEVDSWFERRMAVANAKDAGAHRIRNKITVMDFSPDLFE